MNREQAIARISRFGRESDVAQAAQLVDSLVMLGVLKLDTPESVHQEGVDFIATMAKHANWQRPEVVAEDLAKYGLQIVRGP